MVAMFVPPVPVFVPLFAVKPVVIANVSVVIPLAMPLPVSTVLIVVPLVVILVPAVVNALVFAAVITVAVIVAILREQCERRSQAADQQERTYVQNSLVPHFDSLGVRIEHAPNDYLILII